MLILPSLLILCRNKLIGSEPSTTADSVYICIYVLCKYNIRHACDLEFCFLLHKMWKQIKQLLVIHTNSQM